MNNKHPQHISLDLETMGLGNDALILSIGAVRFNPFNGEVDVDNAFYSVIDIANSVGGVADASTIVWWMNQPAAARDAIFGKDVERVGLPEALAQLSLWLGFDEELPEGEYPNNRIWTRGNKDTLWLESAYKGIGFKAPFKYWHVMDQRTLTAAFPDLISYDKDNVAHNALKDAMQQAADIVAIYHEAQEFGLIKAPGEQETTAPKLLIQDVDAASHSDFDVVLDNIRYDALKAAVDAEPTSSVAEARALAIAACIAPEGRENVELAFRGWPDDWSAVAKLNEMYTDRWHKEPGFPLEGNHREPA